MKVSELGEFGLVDLISRTVGNVKNPDVALGIGDDAAVWKASDSLEIGTVDGLVQDVHFSLDNITWRELGWKSLAVNLSDIAAMGGEPKYALISLGLPPDTGVEDVIDFYRGLLDLAGKFSVDVVGGNINSSPLVTITICVVGKAPGGRVLTRSSAMARDLIAVTGYLGQSAAGLKALRTGLPLDPKTSTFLRESHLRPYPRILEARILLQLGVKAAIDLSDGLLSDLGHVCKASHLAARIRLDRLPVHPLVERAFGNESLQMALSGGEDYELLFTTKQDITGDMKSITSTPVTVIGEMITGKPGQITLVDEAGRVVEPEKRGWDHFKQSE